MEPGGSWCNFKYVVGHVHGVDVQLFQLDGISEAAYIFDRRSTCFCCGPHWAYMRAAITSRTVSVGAVTEFKACAGARSSFQAWRSWELLTVHIIEENCVEHSVLHNSNDSRERGAVEDLTGDLLPSSYTKLPNRIDWEESRSAEPASAVGTLPTSMKFQFQVQCH